MVAAVDGRAAERNVAADGGSFASGARSDAEPAENYGASIAYKRGMKAPILIIEDSADDYEAISGSLIRAGVGSSQLIHLHDGGELSRFLRQSRKPRPSVILLDLNLPGAGGHSILAEIRGDEQMGLVPVVMFSTSSSPRDIDLAYSKGANSYMIKPLSPEGFDALMAGFKTFWMDTAVPPMAARR